MSVLKRGPKEAKNSDMLRVEAGKEKDSYNNPGSSLGLIRNTLGRAIATAVLVVGVFTPNLMRAQAVEIVQERAEVVQTSRTVSINKDTPYYLDGAGFTVYKLGEQKTDFKGIVSPCINYGRGDIKYTDGVYGCRSAIDMSEGPRVDSTTSSTPLSVNSDDYTGYTTAFGISASAATSASTSSTFSSVQGSWTVVGPERRRLRSPIIRPIEPVRARETERITHRSGDAAMCSPSAGAAAQWVGIAGWSGTTLIQAGTYSFYNSNREWQYSPLYELIPAGAVTIANFEVSEGDAIYTSITAVQNATNQWKIEMRNGTTAKGFDITVDYNVEQTNYTEWILERLQNCTNGTCTFVPLLPFGVAQFGSDFTSGTLGSVQANFASMSSVTGTTGLLPMMNFQGLAGITMRTDPTAASATTKVLTVPSPPTADGTSFEIVQQACQ